MDDGLDVQFGVWPSLSRIQTQYGGRSERQEGGTCNEYFLCARPCANLSFTPVNICETPVCQAWCKLCIHALFSQFKEHFLSAY